MQNKKIKGYEMEEVIKAFSIKKVKIGDVEEFERRRAEECTDGFSPKNFEIVFGEDGTIQNGHINNVDGEWLDKYVFMDLLKEFIVDGYAVLKFIDEDLEYDVVTIFQGVTIYGELKDAQVMELIDQLNKGDISYQQKIDILKLYNEQLIRTVKQAEFNLKYSLREIETIKNIMKQN